MNRPRAFQPDWSTRADAWFARLTGHSLAQLRRALLELVYPNFCQDCGAKLHGEENGYFCPTCWEASPRIARPYCTHCGQPHAAMVGFGLPVNFPCADCRETPPAHLGCIRAAAEYDGAVKRAVRLLKFNDKHRLAGPMAEVMREFAEAEMAVEKYTHIVPVPLHRVRQRERGFNQSQLLACEVMAAFPNALLNLDLKRIRPTRTQSRLAKEERVNNVRGAFAVEGDALAGAEVLLVDDVVTTAGTVSECARVLLHAGAKSVDVLSMALATRRDPDLG